MSNISNLLIMSTNTALFSFFLIGSICFSQENVQSDGIQINVDSRIDQLIEIEKRIDQIQGFSSSDLF